MKPNIPYDGFSIKILLDDEGDWLAHFIELPEISAFGESPINALKELELVWSDVKEAYIEQQRPIPSLQSSNIKNSYKIIDLKNTLSEKLKVTQKKKPFRTFINPLTGGIVEQSNSKELVVKRRTSKASSKALQNKNTVKPKTKAVKVRKRAEKKVTKPKDENTNKRSRR